MEVKSYKISATIPTRQYENIQPSIEFGEVDLQEAHKEGMKHITGLINTYSEHGKLDVISSTMLKSFNEDVDIEFDKVRHTYYYEGKKLESATSFLKKFYKPFNADLISKACEKSWGVPAQDIKDMWASNGKLASEFGTVIHQALEHYDKFKAIGAKIESNTDKEEVALPKHPLLKSIITGFYDLAGEGEVIPEALVTNVESGYGGTADRILILGEKRCRIQDYKINIDSDKEDSSMKASAPLDKLPPTKLTKYQAQMSFYANLLQKSGWEVEGLDAFVFEDDWKHYKLDVLNLI